MEISREQTDYEGQLSDVVAAVQATLRRRWRTLVLISALVFALGVGAIFAMTPKYQSLARVQIDPTRDPLAANGPDSATTLTPEAISTEVSLIDSNDVALEVVRRLKLDGDPAYTKGLDKAGQPPLTAEKRQAAVADKLLQRLSVSREKLTYILDIQFTDPDAARSAQIANAFAEAYVDSKVGAKTGTAARQSVWFQQRLEALGKASSDADAAAAQYRARTGILQDGAGNNLGTITDQQVAPLSSQLAVAEADDAAAHAKLAAANQQIARGGLDSVSEVLGSPVIGELRKQRAEVLRSVQEVQARYGDKHPESIRVHDQLDAIDRQISDEANRVVGSLRAAQSAADASVASLRGSMGQLKSQQSENTRNAVFADTLEREAKTKRDAYDKMSALSMTSNEASKNMISSAEIVERATQLAAPTSPNKPLFIAIVLIVALAAGGGVVALLEMMVTGLRTVEDVRTKLGMPVLAAVPKLARSSSPADVLLHKPTSLYAESFRIARTSILGARAEATKRVIAITSALPSEGKTTTALSFARTLAASNAKTLLIECDVRRAQMRSLVGIPPHTPGLVEVLHGECAAAEAIFPGELPNLDYLFVVAPYFSSENLFGDGEMNKLLDELKARYDMIVLDLPPLVGLADGRELAVFADSTVLCLKWNATPSDAAASALGWLRTDGANPVGVIYTMVDTSSDAIGSLYYSKNYSAYYQTT